MRLTATIVPDANASGFRAEMTGRIPALSRGSAIANFEMGCESPTIAWPENAGAVRHRPLAGAIAFEFQESIRHGDRRSVDSGYDVRPPWNRDYGLCERSSAALIDDQHSRASLKRRRLGKRHVDWRHDRRDGDAPVRHQRRVRGRDGGARDARNFGQFSRWPAARGESVLNHQPIVRDVDDRFALGTSVGRDIRGRVAAQAELFAHEVKFPRSRALVGAVERLPKSSLTLAAVETSPRSAGNPVANCIAIGSVEPTPEGA